MNTKNMWIAVLSGAVLTTLVSNLPFIDMINFLCFAGFWASAIFAVWLYRKLTGSLVARQGGRIGALTGLIAGLVGFGLSFLGVAGFQGTANELAQVLPAEDMQAMADFPLWGMVIINLVGVLFNVFFGAVGGWIGGALFRTDRTAGKEGN